MKIREADEADWDGLWPIFRGIVAAGDVQVAGQPHSI